MHSTIISNKMATPPIAPPTAPLERRTSAASGQISSIANKVGRALSPNRTLVGGMERRVSLGGELITKHSLSVVMVVHVLGALCC